MRGANSLWNTMSDDAIPLLMIGSGLVWMVSARRASGYASGNGSYGSGYEGGTQTACPTGAGRASTSTSGPTRRRALRFGRQRLRIEW